MSILNGVKRKSVYAVFIGCFICAQSVAAFGKSGKEGNVRATSSVNPSATQFQWNEHQKLSWEDFKGAVNAQTCESAAATHCGIGFTTKPPVSEGGAPGIEVYNTFYVNKSWVKPDAKIPEILVHEQGHFDLCEIYTRKLRERMSHFDFNTKDVKKALVNIYAEVSDEYETRQQAYEMETTHGTNFDAQQRWRQMIAYELGISEKS